jgi:hypothetical protein
MSKDNPNPYNFIFLFGNEKNLFHVAVAKKDYLKSMCCYTEHMISFREYKNRGTYDDVSLAFLERMKKLYRRDLTS